MSSLDDKYQYLREILAGYQKVIVAYSGGVDSTLLLKAALDVLGRAQVRAIIGVSPTISGYERRAAERMAAELGAQVETVATDEMDDEEFRANKPDRCYQCRRRLFGLLRQLAVASGCDAVLIGANVDDRADYRPGRRAAEEAGVAAPLEAAELTKADIRELSRRLDLPTWDKPAQPCLATRLAFGLEITAERLAQVEGAENVLREMGAGEPFRVRHHGLVGRIEAPPEQFDYLLQPERRAELVRRLKEIGFHYVTLDLQGFRSGSGNEVLDLGGPSGE